MRQVMLRDTVKGEYVQLKEGGPVWVRGEYDRASKKYSITKFDDRCHESLKKGDTPVWIGFTF